MLFFTVALWTDWIGKKRMDFTADRELFCAVNTGLVTWRICSLYCTLLFFAIMKHFFADTLLVVLWLSFRLPFTLW